MDMMLLILWGWCNIEVIKIDSQVNKGSFLYLHLITQDILEFFKDHGKIFFVVYFGIHDFWIQV